MKKLFGEQKKQVEFTAEELENAKKVISAMQDKNVDIVVKVEGQKKKERTKEKYTHQLQTHVTEKAYEEFNEYARNNGMSMSEFMRIAATSFIANNAA